MYYVSKRIEIAGCHSLKLDYESKCSQMHGHNWIVTIHCRARSLNHNGMVCDFTHIKEKIHGYLDHGNFNELLPFNPTAENIAKWICDQIPECYKVSVQESEGNTATPLACRDAMTAPFSRATASTVPMNSWCSRCALLTRATVGWARAAR